VDNTDVAGRYLAALDLAPTPPAVEALTGIIRAHVATFPFSSVGPRLGDTLPLDVDSLFDRIVVRHRGGYCFEQNGLLFAVLESQGYDVRVQLARVILGRDTLPGLTHRITIVELAGRAYVADVGFGPLGPTAPVPMPDDEVPDQGATHRVLEPRPGEFHMQSRVEGDWTSLYRFDLGAYGPHDCEIGHFYSHRHPEAMFVNNLVASRILADEVRSLRNDEYWVIRADGSERSHIDDAEQLHALLTGELALDVTPDESRRLFHALPVTG
jgi:N-hydroxyarylamine O-acetyltransferase